MASVFALALLLALPPFSLAERVEGARAVEKARYTFVIGATKPFDEVYPRSLFEKKVGREVAEERVLSHQFGMEVRAALLSAEYERIEKETRAPDQWEAIKKALGDSRRKFEEVVCRPALVLEKELRAKGDVTTILEERNLFSVFRLVSSDAGEWLVEAVQVPKRDFDRWLAAAVKNREAARPS